MTLLEIFGLALIGLTVIIALSIMLVIAYAFQIDKNLDYDDEIAVYLTKKTNNEEKK